VSTQNLEYFQKSVQINQISIIRIY